MGGQACQVTQALCGVRAEVGPENSGRFIRSTKSKSALFRAASSSLDTNLTRITTAESGIAGLHSSSRIRVCECLKALHLEGYSPLRPRVVQQPRLQVSGTGHTPQRPGTYSYSTRHAVSSGSILRPYADTKDLLVLIVEDDMRPPSFFRTVRLDVWCSECLDQFPHSLPVLHMFIWKNVITLSI